MAELAIPLIALGGLYMLNKKDNNLVNNKYKKSNTYTDRYYTKDKNHFMQHKRKKNRTKQFQSLTGDNVSHGNLKHNNMQPYFGSTIRSMAKEQSHILDNKIGAGTLHTKKKERAPLFTPDESSVTHAEVLGGAPSTTDFIQSRVVGSRNHNDKGWDEIKVGPGLGGGYGTDGIGGFNNALNARDLYREKNVDELRTVNNPKTTFRGENVGPGKHFNNHLGLHGTVEKNRPDRHFEHGEKRMFGGLSDVKKNTIRSEQTVPCTQRQSTTAEYYGIGRKHEGDNGYIDGEYRDPKKNNLDSYPILNPYSKDNYSSNDNDHGVSGYNALPNNRSLNKDRDGSFLGAAASMVGAVTMPFKELLQPTKKENLINNINNSGNVKVEVGEGYYINPGDRLKTTRKETTINNRNNITKGGKHIDRGGYLTNEHQEAVTNRGVTTKEYTGGAGGNFHNPVSDAAERNANINMTREYTLETHPNPGNISILNGDVNITQSKLDYDRLNNRLFVPQRLGIKVPQKEILGEFTSAGNEYAELNHTDPSILKGLNSNPYAIHF
jgi:hypothetical protein